MLPGQGWSPDVPDVPLGSSSLVGQSVAVTAVKSLYSGHPRGVSPGRLLTLNFIFVHLSLTNLYFVNKHVTCLKLCPGLGDPGNPGCVGPPHWFSQRPLYYCFSWGNPGGLTFQTVQTLGPNNRGRAAASHVYPATCGRLQPVNVHILTGSDLTGGRVLGASSAPGPWP